MHTYKLSCDRAHRHHATVAQRVHLKVFAAVSPGAAAAHVSMDELIRDGDHVIIDENSDKKSIHHMRSNLYVCSLQLCSHPKGGPADATRDLPGPSKLERGLSRLDTS